VKDQNSTQLGETMASKYKRSKRYISTHVKGIGSDSLMPLKRSEAPTVTSKQPTVSLSVRDVQLLLRCATTCQTALNNRLNQARNIGGDQMQVKIYKDRHDRVYQLCQRVNKLLDNAGYSITSDASV